MIADESSGRSAVQLEQAITRRIAELTGSQVALMTVKITGNQVQICGRASCYYHKQLSLQAIFDTLGGELSSTAIIDLGIEVHPITRTY